MIDAWRAVFFEPIDVLVNADARGLDDGGTGLPGWISPAAFAGALRTSILRAAGVSLGEDELAADAQDAAEFVGLGGEPPVGGFRFLGPFQVDGVSGELLFPVPRLALADEVEVRRASRRAQAVRAEACLAPLEEPISDPPELATRVAPSGSWTSPAGWVHGEALSSLLLDQSAVDVFPDLRFSSVERRSGHERAASGLPADRTLHSRAALRFQQVTSLEGLASAGYAGLIHESAAGRLPQGTRSSLRLAGDGHLALLQVLSQVQTRHRFEWLASHAKHFESPPSAGSPLLLYLATPSIFARGWRPELGEDEGVQLVAATVGRPQIVGGWDLRRGAPKQLYRAVPAGSVFEYRVLDPERAYRLVRAWLELQSVSVAYSSLGFGWAIPGRWGSPTAGTSIVEEHPR